METPEVGSRWKAKRGTRVVKVLAINDYGYGPVAWCQVLVPTKGYPNEVGQTGNYGITAAGTIAAYTKEEEA